MKLLHLSDLHIGKRLYGYSLLEDQKEVLGQIVAYAGQKHCDAVLVAGDVYDKTNPSAEAVALVDTFFTQLAALGKPVFAVSGNHDSPERIACYADILRNSQVYMSPVFSGSLRQVALPDDEGEVVVTLLPYLRPAMVRPFFQGANIQTYADAVGLVLENTPLPPAKRNVLVAHQFVTGAAAEGSEELVVGGVENIPAALFAGFDYVALGHIHRAQSLAGGKIHYSGAPLAYSFPEGGTKAEQAAPWGCAKLVQLNGAGQVAVEALPLTPLHSMRVLRGSLAELLAMPFSQDFVKVVLTDKTLPNDLAGTLQMAFPYIMCHAVDNGIDYLEYDADALQAAVNKSPAELFAAFYQSRNGEALSEEQSGVVESIFAQLGEARL